MKQLKASGLSLLLLLSAIFSLAQNREERRLSSFDEISVGQAIELELVKGNTEKAVIEVDGIDLDEVLTDVAGGRLRLRLDRDRIRGNIDVKITLTYKAIRGIDISSAADVYSRSTITADDFYLDVSSAGSGDLQLDVNSLDVESSSAGSISLSGTADEAEFSVSSAGSIQAFDLDCGEAYVRASSAGSIKLSVKDKIDARASSGGSIRYKGDPNKEYTNSSSGGSVRKY